MLGSDFVERLSHRLHNWRWRRHNRRAPQTSLASLQVQMLEARELRYQLDEFRHVAEERLTLPYIGRDAFAHPIESEWSWRPRLWRGPLGQKGLAGIEDGASLNEEVRIFHDCPLSELGLRQMRQKGMNDLAPYGLGLDVFHFGGTFLSLAMSLPEADARALRKRHLVRLDTVVEADRPLQIFARLNIRHGPNTDQLLCTLPRLNENVFVEFDLAYCDMDEKRIEAVWVDLIFDAPQMNRITVRDLTLSRQPRAQM